MFNHLIPFLITLYIVPIVLMVYPVAKELVYLDSKDKKRGPFKRSLILCLSMFFIVCAISLWPLILLISLLINSIIWAKKKANDIAKKDLEK
jgi:hypothetical protein